MANELELIAGVLVEYPYIDDVVSAAKEWHAQGFTASEVDEWLEAGCFDPEAASALKKLGLTPEDVSQRVDYAGMWESIAYWVANGDMQPTPLREVR